jgi:hypothetical protein
LATTGKDHVVLALELGGVCWQRMHQRRRRCHEVVSIGDGTRSCCVE